MNNNVIYLREVFLISCISWDFWAKNRRYVHILGKLAQYPQGMQDTHSHPVGNGNNGDHSTAKPEVLTQNGAGASLYEKAYFLFPPDLPCIHICKKPLYPLNGVREWIDKKLSKEQKR